ncbi:MAG: T9SS type A sorting domain-containing protein [Bacteroidota bacterium]
MTRQLLLFSLSFVFSINLFSQQFLVEGAEWYSAHGSFDNAYELTTRKYFVEGDFLANGKTYKEIKFTYQTVNQNTSEIVSNHEGTYGYAYEENGKVYRLDQSSEEDILIYDFSMEVGDTIQYKLPWCAEMVAEYMVTELGEELIDGRMLAYQELSPTRGLPYPLGAPIKIYDQMGLIMDYHDFGYQGIFPDQTLSCTTADPIVMFQCYRNDETSFSIGGPCGLQDGVVTSATSLIADAQIEVFPNPTTDEFQIKLGNGLTQVQAALLGSNGQEIKAFTLEDGDSVDVTHLDGGLYFLLMYSDGVLVETQKVVKLGGE